MKGIVLAGGSGTRLHQLLAECLNSCCLFMINRWCITRYLF